MAEKLPSLNLAICIIDHIAQIKIRQELLELCREELNSPDEKSLARIRLLLDSYTSQVEHHLNELECYTSHLRSELIKLRQGISSDPSV